MLSVIASGLALVAEGRYIVSILKRETRPSFGSWFVFAVSMICVFTSAYALEARSSLYLIGTFAFLNIIIAALALRFGVVSFGRTDIVFLLFSGLGILLWVGTSDPWYTLLISTAVDAFGYFIMFRKLIIYPGTEDVLAWILSAFAYALNIVLIVNWVPQEYLFSLFNVIWCGVTVVLSFRKSSAPLFGSA